MNRGFFAQQKSPVDRQLDFFVGDTLGSELLHCILERLRCAELRYFHRCNLDLLSCFRIAGHTSCALFD